MTPRGPKSDEPPEGHESTDDTVDAPVSEVSTFLARLRPFKKLDKEVLTLIRSSMSDRRFEQGELLMKQGEPGTSLMVVADGDVEIGVDEEGSHHVLKRAHAGEVLGEMALLTNEPRSASVRAVSPVRAWVLPAERFHELAARHPRISVLLTLLLSSRLGRLEHDALTGKIFHGYRIKRRLGRGGMSVVYEAEDADSGRPVALKMMSHRLLYDPVAMQRFKREADIIASFDHPNIAKMYGRFEAFRTSFIVMEFCEGISIDDAITARGKLPESVTRNVLGQLAAAVAYAHEAGIVHHDIKPSNVMVTREGSVKLMDFGVAQRVEAEPAARGLLGTPRYMAPEQMSGVAAGTKTDLFALGLVTFEMLSGEPLFKSDDIWSLRSEVVKCRTPDLATTLPEVSPEVRRVLRRLLFREPEERTLDFGLVQSWAAPVDPDELGNAPTP
jgi:CRP-like cAMP-binding protein